MSLPARDADAAAGAGVLAREASQDIWAQAPQPVSQSAETLVLSNGTRGGPPGYTELCESISEFKRDHVIRTDVRLAATEREAEN
jgi:hypothetical protein